MNVDEVLAKMDALDANEEEIQYIIDENLRVISIPPLGVVLGVEGDKDVNSAKFKMVRYYKGIDLSKFEIRINFANANGDLSYYTVKNPTVTDDTLTFEWLVGYLVTKYKGTVRFLVRMITTDASTGEVQQAFDTTVGEARSLEGLLVDTPTDEKVYDIVAQLKADLTDHVNNLFETIPEDYSELTKKVEDNTSGISELKKDIDSIFKAQKILPIDKSQFIFNGYLNKNGFFQDESAFVTTDYISIDDSTSIQMKSTTMDNLSNVVFFNLDKNIVGKYTGSGNATVNSINVDIPANAKFVRFSLLKSDTVDILMLHEQIPHRTLWLAIGDSITYGYGNDGISYADYAAQKLNILLNKQGVSGSTLSAMYARVKNGDFDGIKPDIITICGGTNDWNIGKKAKNTDFDTVYTADTYMSYVNSIIETLRAKHHQATIIFLTCLQRDYFGDDDTNVHGITNSNGETLEDYRNVIMTSCKNHAVPVIDLYANSGINAKNYLPENSGYSHPSIKWLTTDGLHPNEAGYKIIATYVANSLKKFI